MLSYTFVACLVLLAYAWETMGWRRGLTALTIWTAGLAYLKGSGAGAEAFLVFQSSSALLLFAAVVMSALSSERRGKRLDGADGGGGMCAPFSRSGTHSV